MFLTQSDTTLVQKALKGRAEAWDKLIRRYEKTVYNFALRMTSNREDAMDLMQEVFLSVYRNLGSYGQKASFSSWLFAIASRRAVDFYRRKKPSESLEDETTLETDPGSNPFGEALRNQKNDKWMQLLNQLSHDQRIVVELKFFQDQTFEEMSQALGVSTNTLKSRLYAALKRIKSMPEVAHVL